MKKILYALALIVISLTACKKEDGSGDLTHPEEPSGALQVPSSFGRKVLLEELTGTWCGYCPAGTFYYEKLDSMYPGKIVGVTVHTSDVMEDLELVTGSGSNILGDELMKGTGVPRGCVNRLDSAENPVYWPGTMSTQLGLFPKCGFAIDASDISGSTLTLTVHTGFAQNMYGDYRLNVFITEADVHNAVDPSYDQNNYYSQTGTDPDPSYPYYYLPPTMNDFHHINVLRKLITSIPYGDMIPQAEMVKGNDYIKTYSVNLTGLNRAGCDIVVFVDKYGTAPNQHQVQNVQRCRIGSTVGWN